MNWPRAGMPFAGANIDDIPEEECIRPDARLNSATDYITPREMLAGRRQEIHAERDPNLGRHGANDRFVASTLQSPSPQGLGVSTSG